MANILDADPQLAECIENHRSTGSYVPAAWDGEFAALVNPRSVDAFPVRNPLPVADYVAGLELLCFRFYAVDDGRGHGLYIMDPSHRIPDPWYRRSIDIMRAYGRRSKEAIGFLIERDGAPFVVENGRLARAQSVSERLAAL